MPRYSISLTKDAAKDYKRFTPKLQRKCVDILDNVIASDPHSGKRLVGALKGLYSIRLNLQDRIVYEINEKERHVTIYRVRTHCGE